MENLNLSKKEVVSEMEHLLRIVKHTKEKPEDFVMPASETANICMNIVQSISSLLISAGYVVAIDTVECTFTIFERKEK